MDGGAGVMYIAVSCLGEAEFGATLLKFTENPEFEFERRVEAIYFPNVYVPKYFGPAWQPDCYSDSVEWSRSTWKRRKRKRFILFAQHELDPVRHIELVKCLTESSSFTRSVVHRLLNSRTEQVPELLQLVIRTKYQPSVHLSWYRRILRLINEFIHLYEAMAWLSTLGGAYSAMGDYDDRYAEVAKKISMKQLRLAMMSGDPTDVCRCWIFIAMSAMQYGLLTYSKSLLLKQWEFAQSPEGLRDFRLKNMILGTWKHLNHKRKQRKLLRRTTASTENP